MTYCAPENSQKYVFFQVFCCFQGLHLVKGLSHARGGSVRTGRAGAACGRRPPGPFNLHQFLAPRALVCYSVSFTHSFLTFTPVMRPQILQPPSTLKTVTKHKTHITPRSNAQPNQNYQCCGALGTSSGCTGPPLTVRENEVKNRK